MYYNEKYMPRKIMNEFIVVNIASNKCYKVNEFVYDILMLSKDVSDGCDNMTEFEGKYRLNESQLPEYLKKIYGKLDES